MNVIAIHWEFVRSQFNRNALQMNHTKWLSGNKISLIIIIKAALHAIIAMKI